ncbi:MAG: DNA repair protein RecO C-terminal domain-containing protein [Gammaproteobacteria bacterium]|nr:DNA repair protein RecO C-terminal domain-containing protein [Gammaproteobacteria bacterium]
MTTHDIKGFLLQATRLSTTKWRLTLFCREKGLFTAWMKVSSQTKHRFLEPFVSLWFVTQTRGPWIQVNRIEIDTVPTLLSGDALFAGWYLNELLIHLLGFQESESVIYDAYVQTLDLLRAVERSRSALEMALRQFEWTLLQSLGYAISLTVDARSLKPIEAEKYYQCIPGEGLVEATTGIAGMSCLSLSRGEWASPDLLKDAKRLMRVLIDHLLDGRILKTRALYRSAHVSVE